jgi:IS1 family transposase
MELREKKQQRCQGHESEVVGNIWDHTAVTADSKLVVSLVVGKRMHEHTKALVQDTKNRLRPGYLPAIFTDAYAGYESALLEVFGRRYPASRHSVTGRASRAQLHWP